MQGRPIPVNTPIVVVFNEKGNRTSAQRGIAIRSGIDLGPILRGHLLQDELADTEHICTLASLATT
ncbi:MAG: hypothetical protein VCF25_11255 [Candidatus Poribacteria bacterium]